MCAQDNGQRPRLHPQQGQTRGHWALGKCLGTGDGTPSLLLFLDISKDNPLTWKQGIPVSSLLENTRGRRKFTLHHRAEFLSRVWVLGWTKQNKTKLKASIFFHSVYRQQCWQYLWLYSCPNRNHRHLPITLQLHLEEYPMLTVASKSMAVIRPTAFYVKCK